MKQKKSWQKAVFSAFVIWNLLIVGVPTRSQDVVTSDDIAGGSSVFVFRQSRKTAQVKASFRSNQIKGGNLRRPPETRRRERDKAIATVAAERRKAPKVNPETVASNNTGGRTTGGRRTGGGGGRTVNPPVKTFTKEQNSLAMAGAAETYLERNEVDNAIEYFQTALELNPKNEAARLGLSEAYTRKANETFDKTSPEAAIALYQQAVKYNDKNSAAYAGLGEAYQADERIELAIQNYEKAVAININLTAALAPLGTLYLQKGEIAKADDYLTRAVASEPDNTDLRYSLGLVRYKQNRNDEAIAAFKQTVAVNPSSAEAHYYLGETYDRLDRDQEALEEYKRAVQIKPDYVDAWFDLGVANYNRGRYQEALDAYRQVLRLNNDYGQAHINLADTYRQLAMEAKDANKQREYYNLANGGYTVAETYIKREPRYQNAAMKGEVADFYSNWGFCLGRVQKWDNAIARLNTAVFVSPDAADYSNIGWAYHNSAIQDAALRRNEAGIGDKLQKGKEALQKAVEMKPKFFPALHNLGSLLLDAGDAQGAVNALREAVSLRPEFFPTVITLGVSYKQIKDFNSAVNYLKRATEINDSYAMAWYHLGEAEYGRGNVKEAKKAQEKLKKLGQTNLANKLGLIISGAVLTNPKNQLENKVRSKVPGLPF